MFETTIAGSLPKPFWLAETDKLWPAWTATLVSLSVSAVSRSAASGLKRPRCTIPRNAELFILLPCYFGNIQQSALPLVVLSTLPVLAAAQTAVETLDEFATL